MAPDATATHPQSNGLNAITQAALFSMVGCIVGIVAAGLLVGMSHPLGWVMIGAGASIGAIPLVRWRLDRKADRLGGIEPSLRPLVQSAQSATRRIERAALTAPDGPVAEVLDDNHRSAVAHVAIIEHDARVGGHMVKTEISRLCHQLDELAQTSERLLSTALEAQPTVLNTLIERTELVRQALDETALDETALAETELGGFSEASGEVGRADRDATNDR